MSRLQSIGTEILPSVVISWVVIDNDIEAQIAKQEKVLEDPRIQQEQLLTRARILSLSF